MNRVLLELADGRYALTERLGGGNFGEVYAGRDTYLDTPVAVKLFQEHVEFDAVFREAQVQARTGDHAHVVTVRNLIAEPPRPFVVMDLCPAGSVRDRLDAGTVMIVEAVRWTRDGLAGLAHVHALGVIHRDVKPANWLLLDGDRVAVSDFGVAEDTVRQVQVNDQIYRAHMAPEVPASGTSRASDVWATGCTLYRLLTGEYPFEDEAHAARGEFVVPHVRNRQVPMSLTRVVQKALEVLPGERYPDAVSMLAALNRCRVAASWVEVDEPGTLETWVSATPIADYRVELVERPRAGLELTARKDLRGGAGFRRVRRVEPPTVTRARQILRGWLVEVVEGRSL